MTTDNHHRAVTVAALRTIGEQRPKRIDVARGAAVDMIISVSVGLTAPVVPNQRY